MVDIWQVLAAALSGGVGVQIINRFITNSKYKAEVRKIEIENDGTSVQQWQNLYMEIKTIQKEQSLKIAKLEIENEELRLECMSLQQQINFHKI